MNFGVGIGIPFLLSGLLRSGGGAPIVNPVTTNALALSTASISYGLTSAWDIPDADWSIACLYRSDAINASSNSKTLVSQGAVGATNSYNIVLNGGIGATAGLLEAQVRDGSTLRTLRSAVPYGGDGIWRLVVLQRSAGVLSMKTCEVGGAVITEGTAASPGAITAATVPTLALPSSGTTASRNLIGSLKWFAKGNLALTDQNISDLAAGADPAAFGWQILNKFDANATTWADATGNGNTATRVGSGASTATAGGPTFGPVAGVTEYGLRQTFQRAAAPRPIPVSGSWNGPASIQQARVIDRLTAATVTDWTDITSATRGNFSGTITAPANANWLTIETRPKDYPQVRARTRVEMGVGAVIAALGQSHMARMFTQNGSMPSLDARAGRYDLEGGTGWSLSNGIGARTLLNGLVALYDMPVALIWGAKGGTGLVADEGQGRWGDPTGLLRTRFEAGMAQWGGDFEAVLWENGGTDARQNVSKADHYNALTELYGWTRTLTGRAAANLPFLVVGLARSEQDVPLYDARYQEIKDAIDDWGGATSGAVRIGSVIDQAVPQDGGLHSDPPAYERRGRMHLHTLRKLAGAEANTSDGPRIISAVRAGVNVDLTVAHNGGTALQLPSAGNATGFEVSTSSTFASTLTINSTSFPDGSTIRLTLASDPAALVYVRFGYGQAPARTRMVYDNRTIQGDTTGMLLSPTVGVLTADTAADHILLEDDTELLMEDGSSLLLKE